LCVTYQRIPVIGPIARKAFEREPFAPLVVTQMYAWIGWLLFFYPLTESLQMARLLFVP
jgi:hypothetical protein